MFGSKDARGTSHTSPEALISRLVDRVNELDDYVARLRLFNQALWELLSERHGMNLGELEERMRIVDGRDGRMDGRIGDVAVTCPKCSRISNARRGKCIYCDQEFERDTVV